MLLLKKLNIFCYSTLFFVVSIFGMKKFKQDSYNECKINKWGNKYCVAMNQVFIRKDGCEDVKKISSQDVDDITDSLLIGISKQPIKIHCLRCDDIFRACNAISFFAKTLTHLYLYSSGFSKFPSEICSLRNLEYLTVQSNTFDVLPDGICQLSKLKRLCLANNKLKKLPDNIGKLRNLVYLDLDNNALQSLPDSIGKLFFLEELIVSENRLQALPGSIGDIYHLRKLDVGNNQLKKIPDTINRLGKLKRMMASGNAIIAFPKINHLSKLATLSLCGTALKKLPNLKNNKEVNYFVCDLALLRSTKTEELQVFMTKDHVIEVFDNSLSSSEDENHPKVILRCGRQNLLDGIKKLEDKSGHCVCIFKR